MPDPVTISLVSVGSVVISEGIKFLYGQAGELLKRLRESRSNAASEEKAKTAQASDVIEVHVSPPSSIAGGPFTAAVSRSNLLRLEPDLRGLRADLLEIVEGNEGVEAGGAAVLERVDALRRVLEALYRRELTFDQEDRGSSTPAVRSTVDVEAVAGYVAGVRARRVGGGTIESQVKAKRVEEQGQLLGVEIDELGTPAAPRPGRQ